MGNKPDWWDGKPAKKRQNRRSGKMERRVAKDVGGRVQPGSGSSWRARGDVKSGTHMIEHKYTDKESYSVKKRTWFNLKAIANNCGKLPALVVHFGTEADSPAIVITEYTGDSD